MFAGLMGLIILFFFLGTGLWIGSSLALTGLLGMELFASLPVGKILATQVYNWNDQFPLVSLPLFIFMGELIFHFRLNQGLYEGISPWVAKIPGKLLHSNILGCTLFAAISGSSAATLAAVGTVSVPELTRLGYSRRLVLGTIAASGTLGLLIPPSLVMIIYCVLINESIGQLYLGGIIPGLVLSGIFMLYVTIYALFRPEVAPSTPPYTWKDRGMGLIKIIPTVLLIILVLGGMYLGWTTASEAAAAGCGGAMVISGFYRTFSWKAFSGAVSESIMIGGMILFIITGAAFYATSVAYLGFSTSVMNGIMSLPVSRWAIFALLVVIYLILGCLMDGGSMLVLTLPIIYPSVKALGFDPIWFGVVLVILIEIAQITPPVGMNLFVLSAIAKEPIGPIVRASMPFFGLMLLMILILVLFPELATWLPSQMIRRAG
jgi:C4-dicarboxylate transporter, DctM subunit